MKHLKLVSSTQLETPKTIDDRELINVIRSKKVSDATQSIIGALINNEAYVAPPVTKEIGTTKEQDVFGTVFQTVFRGEKPPVTRLVVSGAFPTLLQDPSYLGLGSQESTETAAVYVRAFEIVKRSFTFAEARTKGARINFLASEESGLWTPEYAGLSTSYSYRAAGTVALKFIKLEPLDVSNKQYPPHIAGMANPLPGVGENGQQGFVNLAGILNDYSRNAS